MNNNDTSSSGVLIGILIVVVIGVVGWVAYSQGFFNGGAQDKDNGVQINLGGGGSTPAPKSGY